MSKKPDNVVDTPATLTYPSNVGAPSFTLPDVLTHKNQKTSKAIDQIQTKLNELEKQYFELKRLAEDTGLVYNAEYSFVPIVGQTYHLYENDDRTFLSLVDPERWKMPYLGSFRYTSDATWERIE